MEDLVRDIINSTRPEDTIREYFEKEGIRYSVETLYFIERMIDAAYILGTRDGY